MSDNENKKILLRGDLEEVDPEGPCKIELGSVRCRHLLDRGVEAFQRKDYETALMFFYKGQELDPMSQQFALAIHQANAAIEKQHKQ